MPGKRQHYVPRLLLRRFSIDPADKKSYIYRLDKRTGRPQRVNPLNEVVIGHYYRIITPDGIVLNEADEALDRIENMAAEVIPKLADPAYTVNTDDTFRLMLFIQALKFRTPRYREALREADERAAEVELELALSDRERYRAIKADGRTEAEVEAERVELLADLKAGRLIITSSAEREIALMAIGLQEEVTATLLASLGWKCARIPAHSNASFVLSDNPVAHYDPTPATPEARSTS